MPDVNTYRMLRALSNVKDMRKSLAEAEYLRRLRTQQALRQEWIAHAWRLHENRQALPQKKATVQEKLSAQPVSQRKIHDAQELLRGLHAWIALLERERDAREKAYLQACADTDLAHRRFAEATRRQEKFREIRKCSDAQMTRLSNELEQAELEDRPHARPYFSLFQ